MNIESIRVVGRIFLFQIELGSSLNNKLYLIFNNKLKKKVVIFRYV